MLFTEISPFVRYASYIKCAPPSFDACAADNHFYYFLSNARVITEYGTFNAKKGSVAIIPPACSYRFVCDGALEVLSINFDYTRLNTDIDEGIPPIPSESFDPSAVIEFFTFDDADFLTFPYYTSALSAEGTVRKIIEEFSVKRIYYKEYCGALMLQLLTDVARSNLLGDVGNERLGKVIDYIHLNYASDISNEELARLIGYHPYHLNRLMKTYTGKTLRQYIINYRLEAARAMLTQTELHVSQVAMLCGYNNLSNFSVDFKRKFGASPSVLKKARYPIL